MRGTTVPESFQLHNGTLTLGHSCLYFQTMEVGALMPMVSLSCCAIVLALMIDLKCGEGYAPGCDLYVYVSRPWFGVHLTESSFRS
jgi:hypothetical protein